MENTPKLYRRRFIPDETVHLKDDIIIKREENFIMTKWDVLKPRKDFTHGYSCYFMDKNIKVSQFLDKDENLLYYYCDIIETDWQQNNNAYVFHDLLIDVVVYEDGFVKVLDIGEISEAVHNQLISVEQAMAALSTADTLLAYIYGGKFEQFTQYFKSV